MNRIIRAISLALLLVAAQTASAESFFNAEVGLGTPYTKDMGDGVWYQTGVSHHKENLGNAGYLAGLTGLLYSNGSVGVRYHLDYTYMRGLSASCVCVPDSDYNSHTHMSSKPGYIPFMGSGHVQGVSLTLEPQYTIHGFTFGVEAGPWVFWNTWHETRFDPAYPNETNLSHATIPQLAWVAGASISRGNLSLRYRYYNEPQKWNPYPGLANGTHLLLVTYTF